MAYVNRKSNGRYEVRFADLVGNRRRITIGPDATHATRAARAIAEIVTRKQDGQTWGDPLRGWIASIPDRLFDRLVQVGLIPAPKRRKRKVSQAVWVSQRGLKSSAARLPREAFPCSCRSRNPDCYRCGGTGVVASPALAFGKFAPSQRARKRYRRERDTPCPICGRRVRGRDGLRNHLFSVHQKGR
jgi:hypothetical protein